ncbi:MAG: hypothetical protein WC473_02920 [Patescibacteria group bacterium]|jgi:hypothetical protein
MFFIRDGWSFLQQTNLPEKVFVVEKFRKVFFEGKLAYPHSWKEGDIEYRIGYYIIGQIGKTKGTWRWGESCPIIPKKDLNKLINGVKNKKTNRNINEV